MTIRGPIGGVVTTSTATTGVDGCAVLEEIAPGDYEVSVAKPGHIAPDQQRAPDVRKKILKQIATAVGDGAVAAIMAEKYLDGFVE